MTDALPQSSAARAMQLFEHIGDLIRQGSLRVEPSAIVAEGAENWVVYTNGITVTVGMAQRANASLFPPHVHDVQRVVVVARGSFEVNLAGQKVQLQQGETLSIPAGVLHHCVALEAGAEMVSVFLPREPVISGLFRHLFKSRHPKH